MIGPAKTVLSFSKQLERSGDEAERNDASSQLLNTTRKRLYSEFNQNIQTEEEINTWDDHVMLFKHRRPTHKELIYSYC